MTEKQDREIKLRDLANKFAGGNKAEERGWLKILRQAVEDGRLVARERRVPTGGVARRVGNPMGASRERLERDFQTVGNTTFAGMPVRVVAPTGRQAIYEGLTYVRHIVTPAAVAAWLTKLPEQATKDIHSQGWAWLGDAWPVAAAPAMQGAAKPASKTRNGKGDRLEMAVIAGLKAYRAKHKTDPTADALFEWLAEHDETGTIEDADDEELWWKKADGNLKPITRKAFANRLTTIKAKTPA